MKHPFITVNHQPYNLEELNAFCDIMVGNQAIPLWEKAVYEFIQDWLKGDDTIEQYSSGTTGKSKRLLLSKQSMIRSAENTCRYFNLEKGQTALLCLPVNYIAGKMMVIRSIVGKLNLQLTEPRSKPGLEGTGKIDFCAMVPMQVLNSFPRGYPFPLIRKLIIGGSEITPELESLVREFPMEVYATYGMAETCSHVAVRKINGPVPEPYYRALPGINLETDKRGCLVVRADYLPSKVVTNDQVQMVSAGCFKWIGRYDNLINSGGIKIAPEELEGLIAEKTGLNCALIGLPDKKSGQRLVFVMERSSGTASDLFIKSEIQKLLPRKVDLKIIRIEKIPRNQFLKTDRIKLTKLLNQMA